MIDNTILLSPNGYLVLSALVFCIGIFGILINYKNLLILLMSVEIMLLSINTNFIVFSGMLNDISGYIFVFFILTIASAETAIGLAIVIVLFRTHKTININKMKKLKG